MEFSEEIATALSDLEQNPVTILPQNLEDYLIQIAKTGFTLYPWNKIKPLFKIKLENVIADFTITSPPASIPGMPNVEVFKFDEMKIRIFEQLESYDGIPFTVQRLCELITEPTKNYKRLDKFMRGLERVMLVVSTTESKPVEPEAAVPVLAQNGSESSIIRSQSPGTNSGYRRLGDSLESPAKRMRLSIEEDGGPCDSAHPQPNPTQEKMLTGNECTASDEPGAVVGPAAASDPADASDPAATAAASSSAAAEAPEASVSASSSGAEESADSTPQVSVDEANDSMEIDTECTSSQIRIETSPESGEGDGISTSAESSPALPTPEVENNSEAEPSMAEPGVEVEDAPCVGDIAPSSAETAPSTAETAPTSESASNEEQQSVESSLVTHPIRTDGDDGVGVADSSDEAEKSQPAETEKEGGPDQSESAVPAVGGAEATAVTEAGETSVVEAEASSEAGAAVVEAAVPTTGDSVENEAVEAVAGSENSPDQSV